MPVRQAYEDPQQNGWEVVSDTSWEGYEEHPEMGDAPHILVQAGVGSLVAATLASTTTCSEIAFKPV